MNENNQTENVVENPSTENKLQSDDRNIKKLGVWGTFVRWLKNLFLDIRSSFIYNNMKLPAILIGIPGVLLGFFITKHREIINQLSFFKNESYYLSAVQRVGHEASIVIYQDYDFSAVCFFVLMLLGILNLFTATSISKKKNLGSVVTATVSTVLMIIVVAVYMLYIFVALSYQSDGFINNASGSMSTSSTSFIMVMISCFGSIISSVIGCVLAFIHYDRTYKKSDSK